MTLGETHFAYIGAFVDELVRAGLRNVCFAPGSRSTPLSVMFARHPEITLWTHLDERSASFFALGMAKASGQPVGLVCSSGTAAANFYPAVIEARYSRVPLIVMTADRPPELQDVGAPQTIDQNRIYGEHARWFASVALPENSPEMLRYVRSIAGRAVSESTGSPAGAVHLNFPFREPLMPTVPQQQALELEQSARPAFSGATGRRSADPASVERIASELTNYSRGLIVCGPQDDPTLGEAAAELAETLGYPVLADPLSHVRCGPHHTELILDRYDAFLKDPDICQRLQPEVIIRFGAIPTAKPFLLYSQRYPEAWHILVDADYGWNDPALLSNDVVHADPVTFCKQVSAAIAASTSPMDRSWADEWIAINQSTGTTLTSAIDADDQLFEGRVFRELARILPSGSTLVAGNSMPVRDMDTFYPGGPEPIRFLSNRGANGIDGVISTALGVSTASDGPTVLVIGDLSFYHDMNGLLAAKLHDLDATIVLINNDGGGIFSFLPQSAHPEHFEQLFGTPHGIEFAPVAEMYGIEFQRVEAWAEFIEAVSDSVSRSGVQVIELPTPDRTTNVELHRKLWRVMSEQLKTLERTCLENA
ncbi:MAG: 2-succinyl-5-enolpyruvyl-6-hydroxy-3-cyclohexene-1-carboxylic-acid synthase [Sphaerobacteraceae bacterium]|nr:MAG: 2-succinyl-5-enolpyruvyl-6-hydroxy-3-cyclohexene-1-carboxylic-acid synthase [Sphaerobacteraceae bacterium]